MPGNTWKKEDIDYLKANHKTALFSDIAKTLGRTRKSIEAKSHRLGLNSMGKVWDRPVQAGELNGNWKGGISKNNYRYTKRTKAKFPKKHKAGRLLRYAIKTGKITRPEICSACKEAKKIEAHHEDYSKPLEVKWYCRKCHIAEHKKLQ